LLTVLRPLIKPCAAEWVGTFSRMFRKIQSWQEANRRWGAAYLPGRRVPAPVGQAQSNRHHVAQPMPPDVKQDDLS
jgi:hypothetical protein